MSDKKQKPNSSKPVTLYLDLLYMTPNLVSAKELAELLKDTKNVTVELWEEMNVLELELPNQNTVDFEPVEVNFKDPSDAAFVKNRNIRTIFAVNLSEEDLGTVKALFEQIINQFSGFLCTDSADFNPVILGSSVKL
jgi:hypothetical protein